MGLNYFLVTEVRSGGAKPAKSVKPANTGGVMDKVHWKHNSKRTRLDTTKMPCGHEYSAQAMFNVIKQVMDGNGCEIRCRWCKVEFVFKKAARVANLNKEQ